MLPPAQAATVSVSHDTLKPQAPVTDVSAAIELDRLLFRTPVRLIDAANDLVATVRSLDAARDAVAAGLGVSYFAELAPGVAAIDVDLDDAETAAATLHRLVQWCDDHSVWWCSRSSGGGPGRLHLVAVAGELMPVLHDQVLEVRRTWKLSATQLDWRTTLRPLAAPHRTTGLSHPPADGSRLLSELLSNGPGSHRLGVAAIRRPRPAPMAASGTPSPEQMVPLSPAFWPRLRHPGRTYGADRSAAELLATAELKAAGYGPGEAWKVLADPAHLIGAKARQRGRAWWETYVWAEAKMPPRLELGSGPRLPRTFTDGYDWNWLTFPMVGAVRQLWDAWSTRERHSAEQVVAVVTEYCTAARTLGAVPASERSLAEDTGFDRQTCRKALRRLCEADLLVLVERFDYASEEGQGDQANTYAPNLLAVDFSTRSLTHPPSCHTPPPAHPLWVGLPRGSLSLWITSALHGLCTPAELRKKAGYQEPKNGSLSTRQQQSLTGRMTELCRRGLLTRRGTKWTTEGCRKTPAAPAAGWSTWRALRRKHAAERLEFRAARAANRQAFRERWEAGRQRCALRRASADRQRRARWWRELPPAERALRQQAWKEIYNDLQPGDRHRRRALLWSRRADAELYDREVMLAS
ncbi:hypothetical protein ACGFIF_44175 [Kribbella sp. NPDC049174]|uniref:hypothetical protein n=1 Tax=Kribbella sp. NPDC049174 TaxID=3364112 RepID=UPI00371B29C4